MNFSDHILGFLLQLEFPFLPPAEIKVLNPFETKLVMDLCQLFYNKFYNDTNRRKMIIGINPGRHGGGITGIPFTDPVQLRQACSIANNLGTKRELSSTFVYDVISAYGGTPAFYDDFYITAVSPLGFTRHNKNLNYYDDKLLQAQIKGFVVDCLQRQLEFCIDRSVAFCLGHGKNYAYLSQLNNEYSFFEKLVPLPHPRFVMQYQLKLKDEYIRDYIVHLKSNG